MPVYSPAIPNIFQIGDVALHLHMNSVPSASREALGTSVQLQDSYKVLGSNSRRNTKIRSLSFEALLFAKGNFTESQIVQRLYNLIGIQTDIIAYDTPNTSFSRTSTCACAQCNCCPCVALWLHATGRIMKLNVQVSGQKTTIQVDMEVITHWKSLNRVIWRVIDEGMPATPFLKDNNVTRFPSGICDAPPYPTCTDIYNGSCFMWGKINYNDKDWLYTPSVFGCFFCNQINYPETGIAQYWEHGEYTHAFFIDPRYWSFSPLDIYVFKEFNNVNQVVTIENNAVQGNNPSEHLTTINFETITDLYAEFGYTYVATDRLIVGDVDGFAHVRRDGEILFYCAQAITLTNNEYPGQLFPGFNYMRFDVGFGNANMKPLMAHTHTFRRI